MLCVLHQYSVTSTSCIQPKLGVSIYTYQYGLFSTVEECLRMINDNLLACYDVFDCNIFVQSNGQLISDQDWRSVLNTYH